MRSMRSMRSLVGAAALVLGVVSCQDGQGGSGAAPQDPNFRPFTYATDPEMQAAIARARATTEELRGRLAAPPRSQTFLSVKVRIADDRGGEHIWLDSVRYDGHQLSGRLNDEPLVVGNARRGDLVQVLPSEITDWMAIDGGRLCGGYTVRLERRRMSAGERAVLERDARLVRVPTDTSGCASPG